MDSKKIFVYFGIIIVAFLLWNSWKQEQLKKHQPKKQTPIVKQAPAATAATATQVKAKTSQPAVAAKPIQVKTDLVDVMINPLGGTIEKVSLLKYNKTIKDKTPVVLLNTDKKTYYVAKSGILNNKSVEQNLVYKTKSEHNHLQAGQKQLIVTLTAEKDGIQYTKKYVFTRNEYDIHQHMIIKNNSGSVWTGYVYNQIVRQKVASTAPGVLHYSTFIGAAISSPDEHYQKFSFSKLSESDISKNITGGWAAMLQHYFISAWVPNASKNYHYYSQDNGNGLITLGMISPAVILNPKESKTVSSQFYAGPTIAKRLEKVSPYLKLTVDYGWLWFISVIIFFVMSKVYLVVKNWGFSIVITTIIIKLILFKLSTTSYRSMARMRKLAPKIEALKQRHGSDRQKLGAATMELYKKEKVNPLGGCLPMLIQIPVFLALYYVLIESVELRQAPFILWIHNLSQPDPFFVLPILMGLSMFAQQRLSPPPPDPTQAKIMMFLPVIFTVLFLYFPAGLVLYWLVNNCFSILHQYYITRQVENGTDKKSKKKKK